MSIESCFSFHKEGRGVPSSLPWPFAVEEIRRMPLRRGTGAPHGGPRSGGVRRRAVVVGHPELRRANESDRSRPPWDVCPTSTWVCSVGSTRLGHARIAREGVWERASSSTQGSDPWFGRLAGDGLETHEAARGGVFRAQGVGHIVPSFTGHEQGRRPSSPSVSASRDTFEDDR